MLLAPKMAAGSYAMQWNLSIVSTLAGYWQMVFQPLNLTPLTGLPEWMARACLWLTGAALLAFTVRETVHKHWEAILFLGWFIILLGPVLPLAGHITDYYLTVPLAALGMLGGWAFARGWQSGTALRGVATVLAALYLVPTVPAAYAATRWWQQRSYVAERLVRTVHTVHAANPGKVIVLEGITDEQFWAAVVHYPFVEDRKTYVFLTPDTRGRIVPHPESGARLDEFFLPDEEMERLRRSGGLVPFRLP
jgi:hypothetical protein